MPFVLFSSLESNHKHMISVCRTRPLLMVRRDSGPIARSGNRRYVKAHAMPPTLVGRVRATCAQLEDGLHPDPGLESRNRFSTPHLFFERKNLFLNSNLR